MRTLFGRHHGLEVKVWQAPNRLLHFKEINAKADLFSASWTDDLVGVSSFDVRLSNRKGITYQYGDGTVAQAVDWRDIVRPMDLVEIWMSDGERLKNYYMGLVGEVRKVTSIDASGKPSVEISVNGKGLETVLWEQMITYDIISPKKESQNPFAVLGTQVFSGLKGNVSDILPQIPRKWLVDVLEVYRIKFKNGYSPSGMILLQNAMARTGYGTTNFIAQNQFWNYQGNIWNAMEGITSKPFNELFFVSGECEYTIEKGNTFKGKPGLGAIVFRPTPYDDKMVGIRPDPARFPSLLTMDDIESVDVTGANIKSKDLYRDKNDVFNSFQVELGGKGANKVLSRGILWPEYDQASIQLYGWKAFSASLDGFLSPEAGIDLERFGRGMTKKARSWFSNNPNYLKGTFTLNGNPEIRKGYRLNYIEWGGDDNQDPSEIGHYYITGTTHSYDVLGNSFTTTARVARGVSHRNIKEYKLPPEEPNVRRPGP